MTHAALRLAGLASALLIATTAFAAQRDLDRSFTVTAGGKLTVDADGGTIQVSGTNANTVSVKIRATGDEDRLEKVKLAADKTSDGVSVTAKRNGEGMRSWFGNEPKISVTVEVPRNYNLQLETSGGDIRVKDLNGAAIGRTSGGRIVIENVQGEVRMKTSGGGMDVRNVQGPVEIDTSGGSIAAGDIRGNLHAHTSGGSIRLEKVYGAIDAQTSGGSITLDLSGENQGVIAKTSGGSISMRVPSSVKASLNASTSGGSVSCDLPLTTTNVGKAMLRGTLNGGGPEILARTSGGSIRISGT
jgi:DUF4097 and DUF4098 domain-containing protein YvlB